MESNLLKFQFNSQSIMWPELERYLENFDVEVLPTRADGFCFLESMRLCLERDVGKFISREDLVSVIMSEIYERCFEYKDFHNGSIESLIKDAERYLNRGQFILNVVDVVIAAAANALKVNLVLYQKMGEYVGIVNHRCEVMESSTYVYMKYKRNGGNFHGFDHYEPIVPKIRRRKRRCTENEKEENRLLNEARMRDTPMGDDDDENYYDSEGKLIQLASEEDHEEVSVPEPNSPYSEETDVQYIRDDDDDEENDYYEKNPKTDNRFINDSGDSDSDIEFLRFEPSTTNQTRITIKDEMIWNDDSSQTDPNTSSTQDIPTYAPGLDEDDPSKKKKSPKRKYRKKGINPHLFFDIKAELVRKIPWNINGTQTLQVRCKEEEYIDTMKDGRWWALKNTSKKGLNGRCSTGQCIGSLMCMNPECPKVTTEGVTNTSDFQREGCGSYSCKICGYFVIREYCGCVKRIEYNRETGLATYYHQGKHNCTPKPDLKRKMHFLNEHPIKQGLEHQTPLELKNDILRYYIGIGQVNKALKMADAMNDERLFHKMRYLAKNKSQVSGPEDEVKSFSNIGKLKKTLDPTDPFFIYDVNCRAITGLPSHVFKTSRNSLEIGLKMDRDYRCKGIRMALSHEKAFFDGMHSRCRDYKTLTLWTCHPGMRRVLRLATMECEQENTESIKKFFTLWNEALSKVKGEEGYKFNPDGIMMDEGAANFRAIEEVYGEEFHDRVYSCQWHFKRCAEKQINKIKETERGTFRFYIERICYAPTRNEYNQMSEALRKICERANILNWWKWWDMRRYHIIPAFRGFDVGQSNLAEIGHSTMRRKTKLWLSVAAWDDTCTMIVQNAHYKAFLANKGGSVGKAPTALKKKQQQEAYESRFIDAACDAFLHGDVRLEVGDDPEAMRFLPSKRACHKAPRAFSTKNPEQKDKRRKKLVPEKVTEDESDLQAEFDIPIDLAGETSPQDTGGSNDEEEMELNVDAANEPQEQEEEEDDEEQEQQQSLARAKQTKKNPKERKRGKQLPTKKTTVGRGQKRTLPSRSNRGRNPKYDLSDDSDDEGNRQQKTQDRVPHNKEIIKMASNPVVYVIQPPQVSRCQGCKTPIQKTKAPNNIVFRFKMFRPRPADPSNPQGEWVTPNNRSNGYFHARDLGCLHNCDELIDVQYEDLYMANSTYFALTPGHIQLLQKRGQWQHIKNARAAACK